MAERIRRLLERIPGLPAGIGARITTVAPLSGGITNENFRVEAGRETLVVRAGGASATLLGIDRTVERAAAEIAAGLGVGPEVLGALPAEHLLVTRFAPGRPLTPERCREASTLRRIVAVIRTFHGGPPFPGKFDPFATVRAYEARALRHGVKLPRESMEAIEIWEGIERTAGRRPEPVPCHNDLLAGNFIDDGKTIRVIDWEYAGMGDPFFDLGNLAANQEFERTEEEILLSSYLGRPPTLADFRRLDRMRLASDLREAFWALLQSGISQLEFDYRGYAMKHLERFLLQFKRWERE